MALKNSPDFSRGLIEYHCMNRHVAQSEEVKGQCKECDHNIHFEENPHVMLYRIKQAVEESKEVTSFYAQRMYVMMIESIRQEYENKTGMTSQPPLLDKLEFALQDLKKIISEMQTVLYLVSREIEKKTL